MNEKYLTYAEIIGGIALIAVVVYFLYKKMKNQSQQTGNQYQPNIITNTTTESNTTSTNTTLPTFNVKFCAEGLKQGDQATIEVAGQGYIIPAGECIKVSGLSEPADWIAFSSNEGASPSPQSGTVSKSKTIYIKYTYPNRPPSQVQITKFKASSTNITQGSTVNFDVSATGGSGSYYFTLYVDNNPVGDTVGPGNSAKLSYTFNEAGTYSIYATAVDANLGANYSATSQTITINVQAPAGTYSLTFSESGLPSTNPVTGSPVTWGVTINGQSQSAKAGQSITFTGLSGTVSYTVQSPITVPVNRYHYEKYYANPSSGTASQSGTISITYSTSPSQQTSTSLISNPIYTDKTPTIYITPEPTLTPHQTASSESNSSQPSWYWKQAPAIPGITSSGMYCKDLIPLLQNWENAKQETLNDIQELQNSNYVLVSTTCNGQATPEGGGYQVMTYENYCMNHGGCMGYTIDWQPCWKIIPNWKDFMNKRLQYVNNNIQKIQNAIKKCQSS